MLNFSAVENWLQTYQPWLWSLGLLSLGTLLFSAIALPWALIRLPADYFINRPVREWRTGSPVGHVVLIVLKNIVGWIFLLAGIAMLFLPGQGLLTILIAVLWLDFPGKRRVERRLIQIPALRRAADWLRRRYHCPPFQLEEITQPARSPKAVNGDSQSKLH